MTKNEKIAKMYRDGATGQQIADEVELTMHQVHTRIHAMRKSGVIAANLYQRKDYKAKSTAAPKPESAAIPSPEPAQIVHEGEAVKMPEPPAPRAVATLPALHQGPTSEAEKHFEYLWAMANRDAMAGDVVSRTIERLSALREEIGAAIDTLKKLLPA